MKVISKEILSVNGIDKLKVYGLQIGKLAIKKSALNSRKPGVVSTLRSFRDKEFCAWLPVWTWLIVHPEGTFLVDTGLSSDINQNGYFDQLDLVSRYYCKKQMKFNISREEEIDNQLQRIGIETESISKIIITHLHIDHVGGFKYFPNTPILVNEKEWETKDSAFPELFPSNLNMQALKLESKYESFENCHYLTKNQDLIMIHTPGHTRGHTSIALLSDDNRVYLFGGDVAYSSDRLLNKIFSSTIKDEKENRESCSKIIELAKKVKLIFLPAHDIDAGARLEYSEELTVSK